MNIAVTRSCRWTARHHNIQALLEFNLSPLLVNVGLLLNHELARQSLIHGDLLVVLVRHFLKLPVQLTLIDR